MNKLVFKPVSLAAGVAGGVIAGAVFKQVWKRIAGEDDTPNATDEERSWGEILAAAAIQGAIFALVKAAVDRGSAEGVKKISGTWPA
ncbi:MAG: hypothetical protein JWO79_3509 [Actinomycetia bacterium]|nr:hypothetical protein [Actinomycetes bacterium]MDQ1652702.1 hypothetical protein [Cryptosporangiaceae bacterium]MDQ1655085.1 hypothetical protein [Cryptosporangiaceae bacterium]